MRKKKITIGLLAFSALFSIIIFSGFKRSGELILFNSPEGRFNLIMPQGYATTLFTEITDFGPITDHIYTYMAKNDSEPNLKYMASFADYPDSIVTFSKERIQTILDKAVEQKMRDNNNAVETKSNIYKHDFPGREITGRAQDGNIFKAQLFLARNRIYFIETITANKNKDNPAIKQFFDSFEIQM